MTRLTVASGLSDGPHHVDIAIGTKDTTSIDGFVVVRRTLDSWIYPWIYAALALVLVLNLASLAWAEIRFRGEKGADVVLEHVFTAEDLRAARMTSERRRR